MNTLTNSELQALHSNIHRLPAVEQAEILRILAELESRDTAERCRNSLLAFCQYVDPNFKVSAHLKKLAELLEDIAYGRKDRITVSIPPRHGKSHLVSTLFPAWYFGKFPDKKVMMVSHTATLAEDFGRKVRNIVASEKYNQIFPGITLSADSKAAGRWNTNKGGEYYAAGVGGAIAGRGADILLVDDPHNEQDILAGNYEVFEKAYKWFTLGARPRLMSQGRVAIIHTRWHQNDLIGSVIRDGAKNPEADQYEVYEFPAILTVNTTVEEFDESEGKLVSVEKTTEKALWAEMFDLNALRRTKASMPAFQWNAQYMQSPTGEEAAILKREWWRKWEKEDPPDCEYVIMSLDAAAEKHNRADFTAITTWGVFRHPELTRDAAHIILLNCINKRVEFPELKTLTLREYREWEPDSFIVEKKSAGTQLYQELRRIGVPVAEFTPSKNTGDKVARLNAISDIVSSGMVWYPAGRRWADEAIEQCVAFPFAAHDDIVDTVSMALMRFRRGGFITLPTDEIDEPPPWWMKRKRGYYVGRT